MNRTVVKTLSFVGAAIKEGQKKAGVMNGPNLIRQAGLFESLKNIYGVEEIKDYGNVSAQQLPPEIINGPRVNHPIQNIHLLDPLLKNLNDVVYKSLKDGNENNVTVNVGGDHSIGSATIHGALRMYPDLKVIWVDAHSDFVDPSQKMDILSQNYHGMPLSHVSGIATLPNFSWMKHKLPLKNIVLIGIRDIELNERNNLKRHGVKCFTMDHVDKYGIGKVMDMAIDYLDPKDQYPFHISFDVDAADPNLINQTGTLFRDGLNHRESCHIVRRLVNQRRVVSMDVAEINGELGDSSPRPSFRDEEHLSKNVSETVGLGVDLIHSLCNLNLAL